MPFPGRSLPLYYSVSRSLLCRQFLLLEALWGAQLWERYWNTSGLKWRRCYRFLQNNSKANSYPSTPGHSQGLALGLGCTITCPAVRRPYCTFEQLDKRTAAWRRVVRYCRYPNVSVAVRRTFSRRILSTGDWLRLEYPLANQPGPRNSVRPENARLGVVDACWQHVGRHHLQWRRTRTVRPCFQLTFCSFL